MPRSAKARDWSSQASAAALAVELCWLQPDVVPPANGWLLTETDGATLDVAVTYCQTAHMVDNATADGTTERRFLAVIPPGCNHAQLALTRSVQIQKDYTVQMAPSLIGCTTAGFGATSATDPVTDNYLENGVEGYLDLTAGVHASPLLRWTTDAIDDVTTGTVVRALKVAEAKVATDEWIEVTSHCGAGLFVSTVTTDLETL